MIPSHHVFPQNRPKYVLSAPWFAPPNGPCEDGPFDPYVVRRPSSPTASDMQTHRRELLQQIHHKSTTEPMLKQALACYYLGN